MDEIPTNMKTGFWLHAIWSAGRHNELLLYGVDMQYVGLSKQVRNLSLCTWKSLINVALLYYSPCCDATQLFCKYIFTAAEEADIYSQPIKTHRKQYLRTEKEARWPNC